MILTFKYRIYPTKAQEQTLLEWFEHLCELQNSARLNRIRAYEEEGRSVSRYEQQKLLTEARAKYADYSNAAKNPLTVFFVARKTEKRQVFLGTESVCVL